MHAVRSFGFKRPSDINLHQQGKALEDNSELTFLHCICAFALCLGAKGSSGIPTPQTGDRYSWVSISVCVRSMHAVQELGQEKNTRFCPKKIICFGDVANLPTCGPLLILSPRLVARRGPPRRQGLCSQSAHLWATADLVPDSESRRMLASSQAACCLLLGSGGGKASGRPFEVGCVFSSTSEEPTALTQPHASTHSALCRL